MKKKINLKYIIAVVLIMLFLVVSLFVLPQRSNKDQVIKYNTLLLKVSSSLNKSFKGSNLYADIKDHGTWFSVIFINSNNEIVHTVDFDMNKNIIKYKYEKPDLKTDSGKTNEILTMMSIDSLYHIIGKASGYKDKELNDIMALRKKQYSIRKNGICFSVEDMQISDTEYFSYAKEFEISMCGVNLLAARQS